MLQKDWISGDQDYLLQFLTFFFTTKTKSL